MKDPRLADARRHEEHARAPRSGAGSRRSAGAICRRCDWAPVIRLTNLTLARGANRLLENASLTGGGAGKSSLFALLTGELHRTRRRGHAAAMDDRARRAGDARGRRAGDRVRAGRRRELRDVERALAAAEAARVDGHALAELHHRYEAIGGYAARARARRCSPASASPSAPGASRSRLLRRLAHAPQPRAGADGALGPAAARRADQPPRPRRGALARGLARALSRHAAPDHARPRLPRRASSHTIVHIDDRKRLGLHRQLLGVRARARAAARAAAGDLREAAAADRAPQAFVDRFRAKATKARQAQSRLKTLERMERIAAAHVDSPFDFEFAPAGMRGAAARRARGRDARLRQAPPVLRAARLEPAAGRAHRPARAERRGQVDAGQALAGTLPARRGGAARRAEPAHRLLRAAPARAVATTPRRCCIWRGSIRARASRSCATSSAASTSAATWRRRRSAASRAARRRASRSR